MRKYGVYAFFVFIGVMIVGVSCNSANKPSYSLEKQGRSVPGFRADSAYHFVDQQVSFGPRNPGSKGYYQARHYLVQKLKNYAGEENVYQQNFTAAGYDGDTLGLSNIIASFNPQASDRIMLCAHWDTRPRANKDSVHKDQPILGADDGGSGVGVLLEIARLFHRKMPPLGVDIILFDGEDYGKENDLKKFFLGSRYWSKNPPVPGYSPRFGILLDMVGGKNAQFPKEKNSLYYAPSLVKELWKVSAQEGLQGTFVDNDGARISDDHVIINRIAHIPTVDIIRYSASSTHSGFAPYWHTHRDNMSIISRKILGKVGQLLTEVVYNRLKIKGE